MPLGSGLGTGYPNAIDTAQSYQNVVNPIVDDPTRVDAELVNDLLAAIVAIETELGINPKGLAASVAQRIATLPHAGLIGLAADDHPQYLLLAGRSPKQMIEGKTHIFPAVAGANPSLSDDSIPLFLIRNNVSTEIAFGCATNAPHYSTWIQTMQDPTIGVGAYPLCLQPLGGPLGIHTLEPTAAVHLKEDVNAPLSYRVENLNGGAAAQARLQAVSNINECIFGVTGSGNTDLGAPNAGCAFFYSSAAKKMLFATDSYVKLEINGTDPDVNIPHGTLRVGEKRLIFGENNSAGAGYRTVVIENA